MRLGRSDDGRRDEGAVQNPRQRHLSHGHPPGFGDPCALTWASARCLTPLKAKDAWPGQRQDAVHATPSGGENQAVDIREATSLYEAGHTIAEVAAILHVTPRTVTRNFGKAGIPRRPRGTLPRQVPVSEIQRLRDKGLTMPQVAEALGITTSLAWRRYRRRQPI